MRLMGLDVGDKRIGIAMSDDGAVIAQPKETLERRGNKKDIPYLLDLAERECVAGIVIGLPYSLDGTEGPQAAKVRRFIAAVELETELPIATWDERFTTVAAEEFLQAAEISSLRSRQRVDRVAAALILQGYLDAKREG